jgi:hypothetical protein
VNRIEVTGADQLRAVSKQLRTVAEPKAMRKELVTGLREATKPAVPAVRAAALALPAHGQKHTGLRQNMAAATGVQVRTSGRAAGVKVRLSRQRLGAQARPAQLMNRAAWRHPTFGHGPWAVQRGAPGWFERANLSQARTVRAGVQRTLDRIEKSLARK